MKYLLRVEGMEKIKHMRYSFDKSFHFEESCHSAAAEVQACPGLVSEGSEGTELGHLDMREVGCSDLAGHARPRSISQLLQVVTAVQQQIVVDPGSPRHRRSYRRVQGWSAKAPNWATST